MSNVNAVLEKLGLRGETSVNAAIVRVSEYLDGKAESVVNDLIRELGGNPVTTHSVEADIVLKSIIELIVKGQFTNIADAQFYGHQKAEKIRREMPYVFKVAQPEVQPETGEVIQKRSKGEKNDKNALSLEFVKKMVASGEKDRGVITLALASELGVEYANAYFYVKKAEKSLNIALTAVKGRKAGKKKVAA